MSREREEIRSLMENIVAMADEVGRVLRAAAQAFTSCDPNSAADLYQRDEAIDRMENANDARCLRILALFQPAADDLRTVFMALKINNDLERIGDHALNIAERSADLSAFPTSALAEHFARMTELTLGMLSDAITAFVARDTALAKAVIARDDEADDLLSRSIREVLTQDWHDRSQRESAVAVVFAAKEFERIADLCTNLAEDVVFMAEGTLLKHEGQM
ncbi:MAG: phosphate signaling complex protein PhoU [Acidobacteriota bacterium]